MKKIYSILILCCLCCLTGNSFAQTTTFSTGGSYSYTVPAGTYGLNVDMAGAQGGNGCNSTSYPGGKGGRAQFKLNVNPGQVFYATVGGLGGYIGGGSPGNGGTGNISSAGGGGYTSLQNASGALTLTNAIAVGGGGGGGDCWCGSAGGDGGALIGGNGIYCSSFDPNYCGRGGNTTTATGGAGGAYGGANGSFGAGGNGGYYGGGGGGGFYGGGGGYEASGGGGSSFIAGSALSPVLTQGYQTGAGFVSFTPIPPTVTVTPNSLNFGAIVVGGTSPAQVVAMNGTFLDGSAITITPPANFKVSLDGITYSAAPITYTYSGGGFADAIFVQFLPTAAIAYSGNVTLTGGGSAAVNIAVSGTGTAVACSGTPTGGTASASPTSGSSLTTFTLSLSGATVGGGITYQWQSGPAVGGPFTDIPGANSPSYIFSGLTATTWYRCNLTCPTFGTASSAATSVTFTMVGSSCIPTSYYYPCTWYVGTSGNPVSITGALSTSISDASTCGSGTGGSSYYYNNIGQSVKFFPGGTYADVLGSGYYYESVQVWIDFNDDGVFQTSETVGGYLNNTCCGTTPRVAGTITIPSSAPLGAHRMRVLSGYTGGAGPGNPNYPLYPAMNPCPNTSIPVYYADTRDYTAIITSPAPSLTATNVSGFGNVLVGTSSVPVAFSALNGVGLLPATVGTLTATAPSNFLLSLNGTSWASTISIPFVGGGLTNKNIYVQFNPTAATSYSGNIVISGGGLGSSVSVLVSGTGTASSCSGTPTPGTASISPTSGGPFTNFTLSLTGATTSAGLFYQWQSSPNGVTWTNMANGIYPSFAFTGIAANTQFRCIVTCGTGASATSAGVTATYTVPSVVSSSCTPNSYYNPSPWYIGTSGAPVTFTGALGTSISDASVVGSGTGGSPYYYNNTSQSIMVFPGGSYADILGSGYYYQTVQVWIDFNDNGSFESGETVGGYLNNTCCSITSRVAGTISIPSNAAVGPHRMRVMSGYTAGVGTPGSNPNYPVYPQMNPCPNTSIPVYYADTRDYTVIVMPANLSPCTGTPVAGVVSATPLASCNSFTASLFDVGVSANPSGLTYQWQSSTTSPTSGFSNVAGANNAVYVPTLSSPGTVYYRDSIYCSNSGLSNKTPAQALILNATPTAITGASNVCVGLTTTLGSTPSAGTWTSSNTGVATVGSSSGVVSGVASGTVTITYTLPTGCFITTPLTVNPQPAAISGSSNVCAGTTVTLTDATTGGSWISSDITLATVGISTGVVTGIASGTPTISYLLPTGCFSTKGITVNSVSPITGITSTCLGFTTTLSDVDPGGTWSSSNPAVATVSGGLVTSVSLGSTNISYTLPSTGCSAIVTVNITNTPSVFSLTGGGSYCSGGTGVPVGLAGSNAGISYQLYNFSLPVGAPVVGAGFAITFGNQTLSGTYGVIANPGTGCATTMSGSATVNINPLPTPYTVSGGGAYCIGGTGVHVFLNSSQIGVNYQLFNGLTPVGSPVPGTSAALDFGLQTATGVYSVGATNTVTGCQGNMANTVTISTNPLPNVFTLSSGGGFCVGGAGITITLSGSVVGTNYQLMFGGTPVGPTTAGTGGVLSWGPLTTGGTYTVVATNTSTGCTNNMSGTATIVVNSLPTVFNVTGGGAYCSGGTGVNVGLNGSTIGVNYQLFRGVTPVITVAGTGVALDFGLYTTAGSYTVVATNATTGCVSNMSGSVSVSINPLPTVFGITGGGSYCSGAGGVHIGLLGSVIGTTYSLYNGSTLVSALSGTSLALDFGLFTANGTYTVVATNTVTGCTNNMSGSVTVVTNPLPTAFNVTGGGSYCAGGTGKLVGLSSSTSGVNYQLYNGGIPTGSPVPGTGTSISFGLQTAVGSYTVVATNATTGCVNNMTGSVAISTTPTPTVYAVTGGGGYCAGGTGVHIGLGASNIGISYQLYNGVAPVGGPVAGIGAAIDFGIFTTAGVYSVVATNTTTLCTANMSGTVTIAINPLPTAFTVSASGTYCAGGAGYDVSLSSSTLGVNYQLFNGTTAVGSPMAGTGSALDFGLRPTGSYTIVATDATTGCTKNMTGTAVIGTTPLPTAFAVTGGGSLCAGGAGVPIGLLASTPGVNYQLYNGVATVGGPVAGTGAALSFGTFTVAGTYTVVGTNVATSCSNTMTGSVTITVNPTPGLFAITGGGNFCTGGAGVHVGLTGSAIGINYQLFNGPSPVGTFIAGTGSALDFGLQTAPGTYTVVGTNTTTGCTATMTGSTTIVVTSLPILHTVTGGGNFCPGGTGVHIGLNGSDIAINYQLYNGASPVGTALPGTGAALDFGIFTAPGTYTVVASNGTTACTGNMTGSATIGVYSLPTVFNVTGTGNYCPGGSGVHVGLTGSTSGVNYQLYNGASPVGAAMPGTGSALDFGLHTAGTYTVFATSTTTGCTNAMNGSAVVGLHPVPAVHAVTGGGAYCTGGVGTHVGLDGSDGGVFYQLYRGVTPVGSPMAGTTLALDFGLQTVAGTYTVVATNTTTGCTNNMTGSVSITISALPTAYNVTGGGDYCAGGTGADVMLSGSDLGTNYQLYAGASPVGTAMAGTGAALDFGLQTTAGTYMVVATNPTTGCNNNMTGSVTVTIDPLPTAFGVSGGGSYCAGGTGVHVNLIGSSVGTSYQLYNGLSAVGSPIAGTGFGLDFGLQTSAGTYTVTATNMTTGCTNTMTGSVTVGINALPTVYTVTSIGSSYCAGGAGIDVSLTGSDLGVSYQLYNGTTTVGSPVAGTGLPLDFGFLTAAGTYTVVAINTTTSCTSNMAGSATITVNPAPVAFTVTGGGQYCSGGNGVAVGLSSSNFGVLYQLYNGVTPVGAPVAGTGVAINFGLQTSAGNYTVVATNPATTCTNNMSGSANVVINALPSAYTVTGGGSYCAGGTGSHVGLSGSVLGTTYQLRRGTTNVGGPVAGTGLALDFGTQTVAGTYTVVATNVSTTCTNNMTGSAVVNINALPAAYAVTGGGNYCPGGSGVHVGLGGSNTGINYQLYRGTSTVGAPVSGTGAGIDFGLQTTAGTYTVVAMDATTGCTRTMSGGVNVIVNPLPTAQTVIGGGNFCAGGAGVHVGLSGSQSGISYQLYNGFAPAGAPVIGTAGPLDFGTQTSAGTYTVIGTDNTTTCSNNMTGSAIIVVNAPVTPSVSISTGSGDTLCSGHATTFTALAVNGGIAPTYQWTVNGSTTGTGSTYSYLPADGDVVSVSLTSSASCAMPTVATSSRTLTVNAEQMPAVTVTNDPGNVVCQGTTVTFTANSSYGGSSPSYIWIKNGVTAGTNPTFSYIPSNNDVVYAVLSSNYHCRLSNTANSSHITMEVDAPVTPTVSISANPAGNVAPGQQVTLTATVSNAGPAPTYQWLVNGIAVPGATMPAYTTNNFVNLDSVTCQVLSSGGCSGLLGSSSKTIHVVGVGVQQITTANSDIRLIPNPNKGTFVVKGTLGTNTDEEVSLEVTNILGQVIYTNKVVARNGELNEKIQLSGSLANGMYMLNLRSGAENKVFHIVIEQ